MEYSEVLDRYLTCITRKTMVNFFFFFLHFHICTVRPAIIEVILYQGAHRTANYRVWRYQMLYNTIWHPDDERNSARNI